MSSSGGRFASLVALVMSMTASGASAQSTTYGYDALSRLTSAAYQNGMAISYFYDGAGNRISTTAFDAYEYLASNTDLIVAGFITPAQGVTHYVNYGHAEYRQLASFGAWEYIASNTDLIVAGINTVDAGAKHYVTHGYNEGRQLASFDTTAYLAANPDLGAAGITTQAAAAQHYVLYGYAEHRPLH